MTDIDTLKVLKALEIIGENVDLRERFIDFCRDVDTQVVLDDIIIREDVTGPLIDAAMKDRIFQKVLCEGTTFEMQYVSKISRDFILSPERVPDHLWEPQTTKLLLHIAAGSKQVIIGGAYVGDQAVLIAKKIAPNNGFCHVFEPSERSFHFLKRNAELNGLNNILFNNCGLWASSTFIKLVGDDSHAYPEETSNEDEGIKAVSINEYCKNNSISNIDLIMLDMEGGEFPALRGADQYLDQDKAPYLIFEIHRHYTDWSDGLDATDVVKFIKSFGYQIFALRDFQSNFPMKDKPIELIPISTTYLEGPPHGFNLFAFKDSKIIEDPLFKIVEGVSPKLLLHKDPKLHHHSDGFTKY